MVPAMVSRDSETTAPRAPGWVRHLPALTLAGLVVAAAVYPLTASVQAPGGSAMGALLAPRVPTWAVLARLLLVTALAAAGGIGLLRRLLGPGPAPRLIRVAAWVAAALGVLGCIIDAAGQQASAALSVLLAVLLLASALYAWYARSSNVQWVHVFIGVALTLLAAQVLGSVRAGLPRLCDELYAVAGALVLGASVYGIAALPGPRVVAELPGGRPTATRPPPSPGLSSADLVDRLAPIAVIAGLVATITASTQFALTGPATWTDLGTGYGVAALAQLALPVLSTVVWTYASRPVVRGGSTSGRWGALATAGLVGAFVAGAWLTSLTPPAATPHPGRPLLRPLDVGTHHLAVLVMPMRPGPNLVHIGDGATVQATSQAADQQLPPPPPTSFTVAAAGAPSVSTSTRPGAGGEWALVTIPAGATELTVTGAGATATLPVDVGAPTSDPGPQRTLAGPDGPECASAALGVLSGGGTTAPSCPSTRLTDAEAAGLRDSVTFLAQHGVRTLDLAVDGSARSVRAEQVVRAQAATAHLTVAATPGPNDTLIVLSGWAGAPGALQALTARVTDGSTGGAVLAPWLASPPILSQAASELVPLTFDPRARTAQQYAGIVSAAVPGEAPSPAGYLEWAALVGAPAPGPTAFYGAARQPAAAGGGGESGTAGDDSSPGDWYPSGNIVAIPGGRTP